MKFKNNFNKRENKWKEWGLNWKKKKNFDWMMKLKTKKTLIKGQENKSKIKRIKIEMKNKIWEIVIKWLN